MNYEEALEFLNTDDFHSAGFGKATEIAIECIEKQIPKKPLIIKYNSRTIPYCPICTNFLGKYADEDYREVFGEDWIYTNYCDCCGQRIDWNKVKEEL